MQIDVKFFKTHPNAQLPQRKHGNRQLTVEEGEFLATENFKFQKANSDAYLFGYRVGFPFERDVDGQVTQTVLGTGDTGYDVFCVEDKLILPKSSEVIETGIELAYVTPGYWFRVEPRSGLGFKSSLQPHLGIIDNPYRGNLAIKVYNFGERDYFVAPGDRICQIVFYPIIEPNIGWSEKKSESARGAKGFGSSGN